MKKIILLTLTISLFSCGKENSNEKINENYKTDNFERIGYPVKLHYVKAFGMNYLIASGTFGEAGCAITNLTLDSLEVEFYKKSLGK